MASNKTSSAKKQGTGQKGGGITDTNLLLLITVMVFFVMYIGAIVFQGKGFLKPQTFLNMLNANAALFIWISMMEMCLLPCSLHLRSDLDLAWYRAFW